MFEIQKSGDKTSSGEIGLDIRTHASPKVGQDQVSGGVSVPCQHATPVADAHGNLYSVMSNSVRSQIRETVVNWWCNVCLSVSGQQKHLQIPNGTGPGVRRSKRPLLVSHPLHMFYGNLVQLGKKSNSVIRSRSVMVKNWRNVLSMEGVTVCGHHPECRVTFGRGGPHIVW